MTPPINGQPQQGDQLGVTLLQAAGGKRAPALVVNGRPIPLVDGQASALATALIKAEAIADLPAEEMRKLLTVAETGLILPGGLPTGVRQ